MLQPSNSKPHSASFEEGKLYEPKFRMNTDFRQGTNLEFGMVMKALESARTGLSADRPSLGSSGPKKKEQNPKLGE
jgi:hypothetical protein